MQTSSLAGISSKITGLVPYRVYEFLFKRDVYCFFYHLIANETRPHVKHLYKNKTAAMFEDDLRYIKENYHPISYEELAAAREMKTRILRQSAFLSFDDGYRECLTIATPLLLKYRIPCTFFITTDLIDNRNIDYSPKVSLCIEKVQASDKAWKQAIFDKLRSYAGLSFLTEADFITWIKRLQFSDRERIDTMCELLGVDPAKYLQEHRPFLTSSEIRALASDGFTIGAHTKSHPLLENLSREAMENEIVESCQCISEITGRDRVPLAFPYHGNGLNHTVLEDIRNRNKVVGLFFNTGGVQQHNHRIQDRIWADIPAQDSKTCSNIPELIYLAYQENALGWLRSLRKFASAFRVF